MNTEEINKFIHVKIMGNDCWHEPDRIESGYPICQYCNHSVSHGYRNPDYCSNTSSRSLLNEVVAKVKKRKLGAVRYGIALLNVCHHEDKAVNQIWAMSATADQIARACVEAWKASENG